MFMAIIIFTNIYCANNIFIRCFCYFTGFKIIFAIQNYFILKLYFISVSLLQPHANSSELNQQVNPQFIPILQNL